MSSAKGISLEKATAVVLDFDGTLVYIEDIQPIYAACVALPEQPDTRKEGSQVFTPGAIRAVKISPYASATKTVAMGDLSDKNKEFIGTFETLRATQKPGYIFGNVEAPVSVRKVKPSDVADPTGAATPRGRGKRAQKRAEQKANKCGTCGQGRAAPIHSANFSEYQHDFAAPDAALPQEVTMKTGRGKPARSSAPSNGAIQYTLTSSDLSAARAQPKGERYAEGNRFYRVVMCLAGLPNKTGTFEDLVAALCSDGGAIPSDPQKVTRRALAQLQTPAFGAIVTAA